MSLSLYGSLSLPDLFLSNSLILFLASLSLCLLSAPHVCLSLPPLSILILVTPYLLASSLSRSLSFSLSCYPLLLLDSREDVLEARVTLQRDRSRQIGQDGAVYQ